ncbi:Por secretion system C-terminal sorting domain-containing protein [Chryseobacterium soldanellicola]|uniref:Por secretion system C-terminal sorting domain-containing protein n=1 Tax=Chryseobacterium soldanellicola TaxID=311333 RepID=A0A1H1DYD7_9FLAO|nr:BspA family leucine-rich repeat surface protein [Chryseobacterium soldanellicola]SDQ81457.1 Por secretion system C-terminal sorting domain-containing protein [Chryseobacterium soldanellicola]
MEARFLLFAFMIFFSSLKAQNEFITVWKPANPTMGSLNTTSTQIKFSGKGTDYNIYWEEVGYPVHSGNLNHITSTIGNPVLIDFGTPNNPVPADATYIVKISNGNGSFSQIKFFDNGYVGDIKKIIQVSQWGNIVWTTMTSAFFYCSELDVTATDVPNLTNVSDCSQMFRDCSSLVGNASFNAWDTGSITNMSLMFCFDPLFNQSLSNWDTSNVTTMNSMFTGAAAFNQPIGNWDTSNVTNMTGMFYNASSFNQPIGNWDVGNVLYMNGLFLNAVSFNQPLENWDLGNVYLLNDMFSNAAAFNQPIGNWNTSHVTIMNHMFANATSFNQPIGNWNTVNVTVMSSMFNNATSFNQPIGNWNTANVSNMNSMFNNATSFNQFIGNWNTGNVLNMGYMFSNATAFNQSLENWNLSKLNSFNSANDMFSLSGLSCVNYDNTLIGWANNSNTANNINLGNAAPLKYSSNAVAARNILLSKGWTITGDIYNATCAPPLATSETTAKENFILYPNPVKNVLYIKSEKKMYDIKIYTMDGRMVKDIKHADTSIDVSDLLKGNYIIKMMIEKEIRSEKFIKE